MNSCLAITEGPSPERDLTQVLRRLLGAGLSKRQWEIAVAVILADGRPMRNRDLAAQTGLSEANVSRELKAMCQNGMLSKAPGGTWVLNLPGSSGGENLPNQQEGQQNTGNGRSINLAESAKTPAQGPLFPAQNVLHLSSYRSTSLSKRSGSLRSHRSKEMQKKNLAKTAKPQAKGGKTGEVVETAKRRYTPEARDITLFLKGTLRAAGVRASCFAGNWFYTSCAVAQSLLRDHTRDELATAITEMMDKPYWRRQIDSMSTVKRYLMERQKETGPPAAETAQPSGVDLLEEQLNRAWGGITPSGTNRPRAGVTDEAGRRRG